MISYIIAAADYNFRVKGRIRREVAGFFVFSHIRMRGYFRLGYVRVNEWG